MKQILHIFWKDVKRFWPEIVICLGIALAFAMVFPQEWHLENRLSSVGDGYSRARLLDWTAKALVGLMPVSWWLLITRVIHAETLVGDRQFWVTRPYAWWKLIGAKALFVTSFVVLPFVATQLWLLAAAGFAPFGDLRGLAFETALILGVLVLPLVALAAVTRNFARMTLTLLGLVLVLACFVVIGLYVDGHGNTVSVPYGDRYSVPYMMVVCTSAVVVLYARRMVWFARLLLMTIPLVIGVTTIYLPISPMVSAAYRIPAEPLMGPVHFRLQLDKEHLAQVEPGENASWVSLQVPMEISGVEPGHAVRVENLKARIESVDGAGAWDVPWEASHVDMFLQATEHTAAMVKMRPAMYEQMKGKRVRVRLTYAVTEVKAGETRVMAVPRKEFTVPGLGICPPEAFWGGYEERWSCRVPFHQPQLTYMTALWSNEPCGPGIKKSEDGVRGAAWVGSIDNDPAELGMISVWGTTVNLTNSWNQDSDGQGGYKSQSRYLCPGAPLTFTPFTVARRVQVGVPEIEMVVPEESDSKDMLLQMKP